LSAPWLIFKYNLQNKVRDKLSHASGNVLLSSLWLFDSIFMLIKEIIFETIFTHLKTSSSHILDD
jgi:hypothetical protein